MIKKILLQIKRVINGLQQEDLFLVQVAVDQINSHCRLSVVIKIT